jgi:UDP-glucose 4-epimerase
LKYQIGPRRAGDVVEIYANVTKSFQLLQWKTKRSIEEAVRDAWNWELNLNKLI